MTDKKRDKYRRDKRVDIPTKEIARMRYEKHHDDEIVESFEDLVENKIQKAMAEGEFDNLEGKGKPLDLKQYREVPEHLRPAYHILKNAGFVPEEVRLKKEMEIIKEKIANSDSAEEKDRLLKQLADISQQYHFYMEYNKQFK